MAHVAWPRAQPLGQSVSLKFSLETRLESEFFEPLIDFLAFFLSTDLKIDKLSSAVGGGARALVRQPKAVVF